MSGVIYRTFSICPLCFLVDRNGDDFIPSSVYVEEGSVYLGMDCAIHNHVRTLLCSNESFYRKLHSLIPDVPTEIEDLVALSQFRVVSQGSRIVGHAPFSLDLNLFVSPTSTELSSEELLLDQLKKCEQLVPKSVNSVLKLSSRRANDIVLLNSRILFVMKELPHCFSGVVVECSFDRLIHLLQLEESCFLSSSVFPVLKTYISGRPGTAEEAESQALDEIKQVQTVLQSIKGLEMTVVVSVDPCDMLDGGGTSISTLLPYIRGEMELIRCLIISVERTPGSIMNSWNAQEKESSADIFPVCRAIEAATGGDVSPEELFPIYSISSAIRPIVPSPVVLQPWPACAFGTVFFSTTSRGNAPLGRLLDVDKLLNEHYRKGKCGNARGVVRAMKSCRCSDVKETEFIQSRDSLRKMQFIVVHNGMDVGSVDLCRRACCSLCEFSSEGDVVSQCMKNM